MDQTVSEPVRPEGLYREAVYRMDPKAAMLHEAGPCMVCGGTSALPYLKTENGRTIVVCPSCGLGFMHPMPTLEEIKSFYPKTYYGDSGSKFSGMIELLVRVTAARRIRFLIRQLPTASRILDVGCGRGTLLSAFADRGFEAHGFELSSEAAEFADPRARSKSARSFPRPNTPTAISTWSCSGTFLST